MNKILSVKDFAVIIVGLALLVVGFILGGNQTPIAEANSMCELADVEESQSDNDVYVVGCSGIL